jgi:hypothetical protein
MRSAVEQFRRAVELESAPECDNRTTSEQPLSRQPQRVIVGGSGRALGDEYIAI